MNEKSQMKDRSPSDDSAAKQGFPTIAIRTRGTGNPNGRPSLRSKELEETILRRMREGESLIGICDDPELPCRDTVFTWLAADEERKLARNVPDGEVLFSDKYAIAARIRAIAMGEEILSISDDGRNDTYKDEGSKTCVAYDHIQRSKLRVDTRKWLMAKLEPKRYGDRAADVNISNTMIMVLGEDAQAELQRRHQAALAATRRGLAENERQLTP